MDSTTPTVLIEGGGNPDVRRRLKKKPDPTNYVQLQALKTPCSLQ